MDITNGPIHSFGNLTQILSAAGQGQASSVLVPDPNNDRGPAMLFQGISLPDIRATYLKDKIAGYTGVVPAHYASGILRCVNQIPAALATNNLAAAQATAAATAMVLAGASVGVTLNVPIVPFAGFGAFNGAAVVTPGICLDFGFAFGNVVIATKQITVADSTAFIQGMPLVIGGVGNAAGTTCLLTNVASIDSATLITLVDAPAATNATAPIGTGNLWGPGENGYPTPTAALPYRAVGPGLFLDPPQAIARGVQISTADGAGPGGNFAVVGYDFFNMAMTETVVVGAGAVTGWGKKAFKSITSITPDFTSAVLYLAGTSDTFGFHLRSDLVEETSCWYEGQSIGNASGWTAADQTTATATTGDVRGTLQVSASGAGAGLDGGNASSGAVVNLAMSGRRLVLSQTLGVGNVLRGLVTDTRSMYGVTQA